MAARDDLTQFKKRMGRIGLYLAEISPFEYPETGPPAPARPLFRAILKVFSTKNAPKNMFWPI
jgi:hypothetical protein